MDLSEIANDPKFKMIGDFFKDALFPVGDSIIGGVNKFLNFIQNISGKNTRQIQDHLGIPQRTLGRYFAKT